MGWDHNTEKMMQADQEDPRAYLKSEASPVESGQITGQLDRLNEVVARLFKVEDSIENKLSPILRNSYPSPASDRAEDEPNFVPLATQLYNITETLQRLHYRWVEVEERIEL